MAPKRKNPSRSTRAGGILKATKSEAIEPSSSAVRASSTQQVKRALNQSSLSMLNKLYYFCTRRPKAYEELSVLVSMFGLYLNRKDSSTLRPKGWISNTVILVAGKIMMEEEKATDGVVTRHMFSPHFMNKVICDSNLSNEDSYKPWCIEDVSLFVLPSKLGYDINQCKLIFAPTLFEEHWSCYAFEPENKTLYVLDSMPDKVSISKKNLDDATKLRFEELLVLKNPSLTQENASITLLHVDVPMQPNNHDCGIYVLKYMETWDGSIKWEDKTMPDYSYKEIVKFRQSLICGWVQHPKNEVREEILKEAGVWGKL
ncbi:putative ubiquitin-like-specific protease 1B isoform X1 [Gastrolobium bilobum]|uniref:putative ubiquitin-like-specific protease 1B isoform X1 n=2 Tax=Gastrolobium bilobum TaxID=150636 RepID=UPI002AB1EE00|nr:putative ubiquitin-like-specific protease 1B isoform X1 [Gastrolobium bilobum]